MHRILDLIKMESKGPDLPSYELDNIYGTMVSDIGHQPMQVLERREANEVSAIMHRLLQRQFPVHRQGNAGRSLMPS